MRTEFKRCDIFCVPHFFVSKSQVFFIPAAEYERDCVLKNYSFQRLQRKMSEKSKDYKKIVNQPSTGENCVKLFIFQRELASNLQKP